MYGVIDAKTSFDLINKQYVDSARPNQAKDYFGKADPGHFMRKIWDTDSLTLIRATQYGGIKTAPDNCYIYHTGNVEVEYYISGEGIFRYPGEDEIKLKSGDCVCQHLGHPHSMESTSINPLEFAVMFSGPAEKSDRNKYESEVHQKFFGGHDLVRSLEYRQIINSSDYKIEAISDNNEKPLSVGIITIAANRTVKFQHNVDCILLVLSGQGSVCFTDADCIIDADCSIYCSSNEPYTLKTENRAIVLLAMFAADRFADISWY